MTDRAASPATVRSLLELGRADDAAAEALRILAGDPNDGMAHTMAATALTEAGRPDEALTHADRAIALLPDTPEPMAQRGWALHRLGQYAKAADAMRMAIGLAPYELDYHAMLVDILARQRAALPLARRTRGGAAGILGEMNAHANVVLDAAPADPLGHLLKAKAALARGRTAMARVHAKDALAIEPNHPLGHQILGIVAQEEGDASEASDRFLAAARADPSKDTSLRLLRKLRDTPSLGIGGAVLLWIGFRVVIALANAGESFVFIGLLVGVALGGSLLIIWARTREAHSEEAREILARDRKLRRRMRRRA
jgi:tetratricopeptide (TPR) repeat protein